MNPRAIPAPRSESQVTRLVRKLGARGFFDSLDEGQRDSLPYEWRAWQRPEQATPRGAWELWLNLAGRGWGKTRTGAEAVREVVESGHATRLALIGRTSADVRDVMVEGESGIRAISPPAWRPKYQPSKRRLVWPNGAQATLYAADKPDQLRGPQHEFAWADELASWRYPDDAWANLQMGLRLGIRPRVVVTTTPRPIRLLRDLLAQARESATAKDSRIVVRTGSTFDNASSLARSVLTRLLRQYDGTRLGRQELYAEVLDDVEGALWNWTMLERARMRATDPLVDLARVVVGVDPAETDKEYSNETGVVVAGVGVDGFGYVLADHSARMSPGTWAAAAVRAYYRYEADAIVAETNTGEELVRNTIASVDENVKVIGVRAARGKITRAEPIAALYEQARVRHRGTFAKLEDQMTSYTPAMRSTSQSPDRLDALVWALTELMVGSGFAFA